jgi:molecular chaperone DnaK
MSVLTPLRVRLPFGSEEEFAAEYGSHVGKDGFFLATRSPKEVGSRLLFDLVLTGGESVLRGEGMVVRTHVGDRPGMTIRFLRLDAAGTDLVERIVAARAPAAVSHPPAWSPPGGRAEAAPPRAGRTATSALPSAWAPPAARAPATRATVPAPDEPSSVEPEDIEPVPEEISEGAVLVVGDEPLEGGGAPHEDEPLTPPVSLPVPAEATPEPQATAEHLPEPETSRFGTMARHPEAAQTASAPPADEVPSPPPAPEPPELVVTEFLASRKPALDVHAAVTPPAGTPVVREVIALPPPEPPLVEAPPPAPPSAEPSPPEPPPASLPYQLEAEPPSAVPTEAGEASFREVAEALALPSVHDRPTQPIPLVSTMEIPEVPAPEAVPFPAPPVASPPISPEAITPAAVPVVEAREAESTAAPAPPAPAPVRTPRETPAATAVLGIDLGPEFVRMAWIREGRAEALALGADGGPLDFRVRLVREPGAPPRVLPHDAPEPALWVGAPLPFLGLRADSPLFRTVARRWPAPLVADDRGEPAFALEGGTVGATELLAALLRWLRHRAEELTGRQIARVVLPVPVSFTALQRERLREAAERAGLEGVRLIHAPTAAAMAFAHGRGLARRRILVWRLGASAFDVAVLAASGDDLDMVAAAGDPSLGGMNFDEQIALTLDKTARADPALLRKRIGEAEQLKRLLDDPALEEATVEGGGRLGRAELEARTSALVERGVLLAREVLRSASLGPDSLDELLLVGGTSRLPHVRRLVEEAVGRSARNDLDVGGAVAQGAAIIGHLLAPSGPKSASRTAVHEVLGVPLEAVAPELGQVRVLERNTRLPAEKTVAVPLGIGVALEVQLFQGPGKAPDSRSFLGLLRAPVDRAGEWTLHLSLDTDGILHAAATNPSGKRQLLQLQTPVAPVEPEPPARPAEPETPAPEAVAPGLLGGLKRLFGRK